MPSSPVAVGLAEVVAHPVEHLHLDVAGLLVGGTVLYLATFGYTRWRMFRKVSTTRLGAAVACLPVLALAPVLPGVVVVVLLFLVVAGLNVIEAVLVSRAKRMSAEPAVVEPSGIEIDDA